MTPAEFARDYTEYYQNENNDSPERSRQQLIHRLVFGIHEMLQKREAEGSSAPVRILDMGAGRQILESELQRHPRFKYIADRVQIITLDIALLKRSQLLAQSVDHVTADGSNLPFAENAFDVVYSSMAIDFMPRSRTFKEVKRVLRPDGKIFINFHHEDLIDIKGREQDQILDSMRSVARQMSKLKLHAQDSSNYEKRVNALEREREVLQRNFEHNEEFFGHIFPALIFHSTAEIMDFMQTHFPYAFFNVREFTNLGTNGWYALDGELDSNVNKLAATG